jgi:hypothetical protein
MSFKRKAKKILIYHLNPIQRADNLAMKPILWIFAWGWIGLFGLGTSWAGVEPLSLPITLDPPLLRAFLIQQAYTEPGDRAILGDKKDDCNRVELWDPQIEIGEELTVLSSRIRIRAGLAVGTRCLPAMDWEGAFEGQLKPFLDPEGWRLKFQVKDSRLYRQSADELSAARAAWDVAKRYVHPHLEKIFINLAPPLARIRELVPALVAPERREETAAWLETLRLGSLRSSAEAIRIELLLEMDRKGIPPVEAPVVTPLGEADFKHLEALWELWDPFLVFQILALAGQPLTEEERDRLLGILLEMRHRFEAVEEQGAPPPTDLVREQFLAAWTSLGPLFRKYLVREPSPSLVGYLGFFTVMDALSVLDRIGPAFGFEISRSGLVRLARLLDPGRRDWQPEYSLEVDRRLRSVLSLGPPLEISGTEYEEEELEFPDGLTEEPGEEPEAFLPFRLRPASSSVGKKTPAGRELLAWIPPSGNSDRYTLRVQKLLTRTVERVLARKKLDPKRQRLFRSLVPATAWQESCWRQLIVSGGKIRYLRSYNRTSVGLMQVHVRVWRGIYTPKSLRWNIQYNALAGAEILELYLRRYGLKRVGPDDPLDDDLLARAVYAMYNGGPPQFDLFLKRVQKDRLQISDRLFKEKYDWVEKGRWDKLGVCLTGRET